MKLLRNIKDKLFSCAVNFYRNSLIDNIPYFSKNKCNNRKYLIEDNESNKRYQPDTEEEKEDLKISIETAKAKFFAKRMRKQLNLQNPSVDNIDLSEISGLELSVMFAEDYKINHHKWEYEKRDKK